MDGTIESGHQIGLITLRTDVLIVDGGSVDRDLKRLGYVFEYRERISEDTGKRMAPFDSERRMGLITLLNDVSNGSWWHVISWVKKGGDWQNWPRSPFTSLQPGLLSLNRRRRLNPRVK